MQHHEPMPSVTPDEPTPPSTGAPLEGDVGSPSTTAYATRTQKRAAMVDGWRRDCLGHVTTPIRWIAMALAYAVILVLAQMAPSAPLTILIMIAATIAGWIALLFLARRDRHFRWLATLTPVTDRTTFEGETTILAAAVDALSATLRNPRSDRDVRLQAMRTVLHAAAPVMARGRVTRETAAVEGYPAWPEVDRTEMPGQPGDLLSVHLIRIDATAKSMVAMTGERLLFEETVGRVAGEVVPPLRAMEAVVAGS